MALNLINKRKKSIRRNIYLNHKYNGDITFLKKYYYYRYLNLEYKYFDFDLNLYEKKYCKRFIYTNTKIDRIILKEFKNENMRLWRCTKRIEKMFMESDNLYFLTFTINSNYINKYQNDFPLYITYLNNFFRYTRKFFNDYVFNLDLGSINGRLHAHCLCSSDLDTLDLQLLQSYYCIGNLDVKRCYNDKATILSKYISKLSLHAFKDTSLLQCHYSRKFNL